MRGAALLIVVWAGVGREAREGCDKLRTVGEGTIWNVCTLYVSRTYFDVGSSIHMMRGTPFDSFRPSGLPPPRRNGDARLTAVHVDGVGQDFSCR